MEPAPELGAVVGSDGSVSFSSGDEDGAFGDHGLEGLALLTDVSARDGGSRQASNSSPAPRIDQAWQDSSGQAENASAAPGIGPTGAPRVAGNWLSHSSDGDNMWWTAEAGEETAGASGDEEVWFDTPSTSGEEGPSSPRRSDPSSPPAPAVVARKRRKHAVDLQVPTMTFDKARKLLATPGFRGDGPRPSRIADLWPPEEALGKIFCDAISKRPTHDEGGRTDTWVCKGKDRIYLTSSVPVDPISLATYTHTLTTAHPTGGQNGTRFAPDRPDIRQLYGCRKSLPFQAPCLCT